MKSSSKALVMAMILGFSAWVLDAWVSWLFFPGATFRELLIEPDPGRTLYIRSMVVLLFFLFGLYTGHLMLKLESARERERQAESRKLAIQERMYQATKLESIGVLAGGVAHDFNNLLQTIIGSAYLANLHNANQEDIRTYLEDIRHSADRASRLCGQLLTFAGQQTIPLRTIPADETIDAIHEELDAHSSGGQSLEVHLNAPDALILGNKDRLREMLGHLVQNALESSGPDADTPVVLTTRLVELAVADLEGLHPPMDHRPGPFYQVMVSDQGCGIDPDILPRIFDPFVSTKFMGRGLGLAAVVGLAKSFRGGIRVESAPGMGTRASLYFPGVSRPSAPPPVAAQTAQASSPLLQNGIVWVVDDEPLILMTLQRVLNKWGYDVQTAEGRKDFLSRFPETAGNTACVLLDLTMSDASGAEVFRDIRESYPHLPVGVMSGYSTEQTQAQFKEEDVSFFLHKPFSVEELKAALNRLQPGEANPGEMSPPPNDGAPDPCP